MNPAPQRAKASMTNPPSSIAGAIGAAGAAGIPAHVGNATATVRRTMASAWVFMTPPGKFCAVLENDPQRAAGHFRRRSARPAPARKRPNVINPASSMAGARLTGAPPSPADDRSQQHAKRNKNTRRHRTSSGGFSSITSTCRCQSSVGLSRVAIGALPVAADRMSHLPGKPPIRVSARMIPSRARCVTVCRNSERLPRTLSNCCSLA